MNKAKIISYKMLNDDILEMILEIEGKLEFKPWQRALIWYQDEQWEFKRAYSIADHQVDWQKTLITLCIKLLEKWRWSTILRDTKQSDELAWWGIWGHFVLQENNTDKVFIWTGTGLVPIYNMAKNCNSNKTLIYSTPYQKEIFYEDKIKNITDLKYEIHITREEIQGYKFGRFDLDSYDFDNQTEFYICGNPHMVKATVEKLKELWMTKIFFEQF